MVILGVESRGHRKKWPKTRDSTPNRTGDFRNPENRQNRAKPRHFCQKMTDFPNFGPFLAKIVDPFVNDPFCPIFWGKNGQKSLYKREPLESWPLNLTPALLPIRPGNAPEALFCPSLSLNRRTLSNFGQKVLNFEHFLPEIAQSPPI